MNCQRIDTLLDGHAVTALSAAERAEVDSHLESCPRCADVWLSHEILTGETPVAPRSGLLDETLARAMAGAAGGTRRRTARRRHVSTLGLAAAALVAVGLAGLLLPDTNRMTGPPTRETVASELRPKADDSVPETVASVALAAEFTAGRQYERLPMPAPTASAPGRIEVAEFFTFGCIHCFDFEPALQAWVEARPDDVDFVRVPAVFNATARLHARAFYTAEALGRLDDLVEPFFEEIHLRGNRLATVSAIRQFFGRFGVEGRRFDEVFDSFTVEARLRRAEELNRLFRVSTTPSIGVNGKYLTDGSMAGSNRLMLDVVDALVESEARALCPGRDASRCPLR